MKLIQIGIIHSPFNLANVPYQGRVSKEICEVEVFSEYSAGLKDIETFSHVILIFYLHEHGEVLPLIHRTRWGPELRGVFATRSPFHPNPIGITVSELIEKKDNILEVRGCDAIDGTPLIDIKPYVAGIDCVENASSGWLGGKL